MDYFRAAVEHDDSIIQIGDSDPYICLTGSSSEMLPTMHFYPDGLMTPQEDLSIASVNAFKHIVSLDLLAEWWQREGYTIVGEEVCGTTHREMNRLRLKLFSNLENALQAYGLPSTGPIYVPNKLTDEKDSMYDYIFNIHNFVTARNTLISHLFPHELQTIKYFQRLSAAHAFINSPK